MAIITDILNELKVFPIDRIIMVPTIVISIICFLLPLLIYIIHDKIMKKENRLIESEKLKIIIIASAYIGSCLLFIILSMHAVLFMAVPPLLAAQYPYKKRFFIVILILTIIIVPITMYGSFFLGIADRNLLKNMLTDEEAKVLSNRLDVATKQRMMEIFIHYAVPRIIAISCIDILLIGIVQRNKAMIDEEVALSNKVQEEMDRRNYIQNCVIEDLASVIETRDVSTGEHVARTKLYVGLIARELQKIEKYKELLSDKNIELIENSAPLHDVGKISISDQILLKPGKLTDEEFAKMKTHSKKGGEMIMNIFNNFEDDEFIMQAYNIAMYHHEKWDGTGYPEGLKGEMIPLAARIMAIADVFDALVSERIYKKTMDPIDAFDVIIKSAGSHFDPDIVHAIINIKDVIISASKQSLERKKYENNN